MENIYDMATMGAKLYHATYDPLTEEQRRIVRCACDLFKIAANAYGVMNSPYENTDKKRRMTQRINRATIRKRIAVGDGTPTLPSYDEPRITNHEPRTMR